MLQFGSLIPALVLGWSRIGPGSFLRKDCRRAPRAAMTVLQMFNHVGNDARLVFTGSLAKSPRVTHHASRGFEKAALVLFITVLALLFPLSPVTAQTDPTESYDENTELTVHGSVIEAKREMPGPFVIKLRTRNRTYNVVTAPPWYLTREQIVLREGLELEVTGSK